MKTKLSPDYGGGHMDRNQDVPVVLHHLLEPEVRMKRRQGNEKTGERGHRGMRRQKNEKTWD